MTTDALALAAVGLAVANNDADTLTRLAAQLDAEDAERRSRLERPEALAEAAQWYAAQGVAVFPLRAGGKIPGLPKAHPDDEDLQQSCKRACGRDGHGLYDATTDRDRVAAWWQWMPRANIGFRTGLVFDVIDVDGPPGYRSLADLRDDDALPDILGRVITSRGGTHLYVPVKEGAGNKAGLLPGIDYRGSGGYVVAPPSHSVATGHHWSWMDPLDFVALAKAAA